MLKSVGTLLVNVVHKVTTINVPIIQAKEQLSWLELRTLYSFPIELSSSNGFFCIECIKHCILKTWLNFLSISASSFSYTKKKFVKTDLACHNVKQFIVLSSLTVTLSLLLTMNDSYMNNTWKVFFGCGTLVRQPLVLKKEAIGKFGHHCIIMSPRYTKITLTFGICRKRNRVGSEKRGICYFMQSDWRTKTKLRYGNMTRCWSSFCLTK